MFPSLAESVLDKVVNLLLELDYGYFNNLLTSMEILEI